MSDSPASRETADTRIDVYEFIDGHAVPGDWEQYLAHRNDRKRLFRVDVSTRHPESLKDIISAIQQNPLVLERCLDPDAMSGIHLYEDMLALQLPAVESWEASSHPKLSIFCLSNALITIRTHLKTDHTDTLPKQRTVPGGRQPGTEELLFSLLDKIVDHASELTLKTRIAVDQLESDIQKVENEEQLGRRILSLKRAAAQFEIALEAKHQTLMGLLSLDTRLINLPRIREPLHDVVAHIEHSLRYIERVEDHLAELERHFMLLLQDRTNNRLRLLTIISAIFMPLTLIAGIYGMNFHFMPELSWHYGYWAVLLIMLLLALGLIGYFHHKGWFR